MSAKDKIKYEVGKTYLLVNGLKALITKIDHSVRPWIIRGVVFEGDREYNHCWTKKRRLDFKYYFT